MMMSLRGLRSKISTWPKVTTQTHQIFPRSKDTGVLCRTRCGPRKTPQTSCSTSRITQSIQDFLEAALSAKVCSNRCIRRATTSCTILMMSTQCQNWLQICPKYLARSGTQAGWSAWVGLPKTSSSSRTILDLQRYLWKRWRHLSNVSRLIQS